MNRAGRLLIIAILAATCAARSADAEQDDIVVVELFTSEGCSSCPPADAYLSELADDKTLLPLSMHVDYWDYIGWKDPFGLPDATRRQRAYAKELNVRYVYTPQMVVQGQAEGVGSDRDKIKSLIRVIRHEAKTRPPVPITLTQDAGGAVRVRIPDRAGRPETPATLYLVTFERARTVRVRRGENQGRTLTHHNVVRGFAAVGTWGGGAFEASVPLPALTPIPSEDPAPPALSVALLVQEGQGGRIIGAARFDLD